MVTYMFIKYLIFNIFLYNIYYLYTSLIIVTNYFTTYRLTHWRLVI